MKSRTQTTLDLLARIDEMRDRADARILRKLRAELEASLPPSILRALRAHGEQK